MKDSAEAGQCLGLKNKGGDVSTCALALGLVFSGEPADIAKVAHR